MVTLPFTVTLPASVHTIVVRVRGVVSYPGLDNLVEKALVSSDVPNVRSGLQIQRQAVSKKLKDAEVKAIAKRTKSYEPTFTPLPPLQTRPYITAPPLLLSDSDDKLDGDLTLKWSKEFALT